MSDGREAQRQAFLDRHGWSAAAVAPLAGDASFRRYFRIVDRSRRAVLMDAPPPQENVRPFVAIAEILSSFGYSAPGVFAQDVDRGFLLLEDLGDASFNRVLAHPGNEQVLYAAAVDLLADLRARVVPSRVPPFDKARIYREVGLFLDWFWPAHCGERAGADQYREYRELWSGLLPVMRGDRDTLVLFDYHVDNLIWLPERAKHARVGLLDFQDAVRGPAAYDLVSLIEDARRDVAPELAEEMLARYADRVADLDTDDFRAAYAAVGAQRNTRIIGVFARLWLRDAKPGYLAMLPRVWRLLERDLSHPTLAPLRRWFERMIPRERRSTAPIAERFHLPEHGR
ncbi:MAG: aminoglycoside phosphotransferase [Alphaproteobacteria bacterium]|nr:aminoglycoside phosphotransferase [Alphaproteobacteria bacterium]